MGESLAQWTTTAPTVPGFYWWRRVRKNLRLTARPLCLRKHPVLGMAWHNGAPIVPTADGEWWSEPIITPDKLEQDDG